MEVAMPVDSRVVFDEKFEDGKVEITGTLSCTVCFNDFVRTVKTFENKADIWKTKEEISEELAQHSHG